MLAGQAGASTKASKMHYLKALLLQHGGDFAGALKEYESAAQLDPRSPFILQQAAELSIEVGQPEKALEFARRLVALEPKGVKAHILLGQVLWARGESAEAQKAFEQALSLEPKSTEAMFALGHLLSALSPDKAKKYFERYLTMNPENAAEAHYQIALVDQRQGLWGDAVAHLKAAIRIEPENPQGHYSLAQVYEVQKDTDAALGEYRRLLEMQPSDVNLIDHVGELYFLKEDFADAEAEFLKAKAIAPRHPGTCLWLALLAEKKGDFATAAHYLEESSALGQEAELSLRLSYYLTQANRLQDSVRVLEEAHAKWPDATELSYFLALGYGDLKRYEPAVSLLQDVLKRKPESRDAHFQLGALYEKLGRIDEMRQEFAALLDRSPGDAAAMNYLSYSLADRGVDLPSAEQLAKKAVELDPENGAYRDTLGWTYFKQKNFPKAAEELEKATALLPDDPTVWDHMGDALRELKSPIRAWEAWKTSSANDPENKHVVEKVNAAESSWSSRELGERLFQFFQRRQGGFASYGAVADLNATVGGKTVHLTGLLSYKAPGDLSLEILGPLMVPMFHARLSGDRPFEMDPIPLEEVSREQFQKIMARGFTLMRDYLSGALFGERPVDYHNGWRTRWMATPKHQVFLDETRGRIQGVKSEDEFPVRLSIDEFKSIRGHTVPAFFRLEGKGFSFTFRLQNPKASFQETAAVPALVPVSAP